MATDASAYTHTHDRDNDYGKDNGRPFRFCLLGDNDDYANDNDHNSDSDNGNATWLPPVTPPPAPTWPYG